jgi:hypothetical protein
MVCRDSVRDFFPVVYRMTAKKSAWPESGGVGNCQNSSECEASTTEPN